MTGFKRLLLAWIAASGLLAGCNAGPPADSTGPEQARSLTADFHQRLDTRALPPEAVDVLGLIQRGGPFPYRKDGSTFQNREKRLPMAPRGYYREYTVPTPGERTRGARRIVTGGHPPEVYYYTPDHYRSFRKIPEQP